MVAALPLLLHPSSPSSPLPLPILGAASSIPPPLGSLRSSGQRNPRWRRARRGDGVTGGRRTNAGWAPRPPPSPHPPHGLLDASSAGSVCSSGQRKPMWCGVCIVQPHEIAGTNVGLLFGYTKKGRDIIVCRRHSVYSLYAKKIIHRQVNTDQYIPLPNDGRLMQGKIMMYNHEQWRRPVRNQNICLLTREDLREDEVADAPALKLPNIGVPMGVAGMK